MQKKPNLPKLKLDNLRRILVISSLLMIFFTGGYFLGSKKISYDASRKKIVVNKDIPTGKDVDFTLFWQIWDTMQNDYLFKDRLNQNDMVYGAISGLVASAKDPYTVFLPPSENKVVQEDLSGSFEGIGIQIGYKGSRLAVIAPLNGSPAQKAGIKAGDFIVGIKDENKGIDMGTIGITLPEAVQAIRGPKGSMLTLALTRDGTEEPVIVEIKREEINVPSVTLTFEGDGKDIAHLTLSKFVEISNSEWENSVREILKSNTKSIILDLRNNPGGYLQTAVDFAGEFLPENSLVVIEENASGIKNEFRTESFPRLEKYKVVIIVDKGSASASEILAAALRENKEIKLIGETTFGKGTIQEPRQIEYGSSLHITTSKWLTPKGNWINEKGVSPDIVVEDDIKTEADEQLQKAIEELQK